MAMKRTLLELTQDILASMDGEEVTDIADTSESASVANIVRQNFYEIASNFKLPEHHTFFALTETSSSTPTMMTKPSDVMSISWIKYNYILTGHTDPEFNEVAFMPKNDFFRMLDGFNTDYDTIDSYDATISGGTFPIKYINDKMPQYYTSYDDNTLVFDSFDVGEDTFLRANKTWCWGLKEASWSHTSSHTPALDHKLSNLLFQRAKSQCFMELKQVEQPSAERKARRAELTLNKEKHDINADNVWYYHNPAQLPNYGRK